jgi:hypothetical protein
METLKARRAWSEVFWALMKITSTLGYSTQQNYHSKFKIDGAIKAFYNKQKLKQYMTTKPILQKILQGILYTESESKQNHERTDSTKRQEKKKTRNQRVTLIQLHIIKSLKSKNN